MEASNLLRDLMPSAPNALLRAQLQRDVMEICATAYNFQCVVEAFSSLSQAISVNPELRSFWPDVLLYILKTELWFGKESEIQAFLDRGGVFSVVNPASHPGVTAEMQLTLQPYFAKINDLKSSEHAISSAVLSLLLVGPDQNYVRAKILVDLISARMLAQDILGAFQIWAAFETYITRSLNPESIYFAKYQMIVGELFSFTNQYSKAAALLDEASKRIVKLDMNADIRSHYLSTANSLMSASFALSEDLAKAKAIHAVHPMQSQRNTILDHDEFKNYQEFIFGVSDTFLSAINGESPDPRWEKLFIKQPQWNMGEIYEAAILAYRQFALGTIALGQRKSVDAAIFFKSAAKLRIDNFEKVQKANFEGFPLPSVVDKIIITIGLEAAARAGDEDDLNLMLRGSELLGRNLRHALSDASVLISSQVDSQARSDIHSYLHLLRDKKMWEIEKLQERLGVISSAQFNAGQIIGDYTRVVATLARLKERISSRPLSNITGYPNIQSIRKLLKRNEAFVSYFPTATGIGKLCISLQSVQFAVESSDHNAIARHARLLEFATRANYAPDPSADTQYPVDSAIYLARFLFGQLDTCLTPGTHITIAMPPDFAGLPLGALLRDAPPRRGEGYDLRKANWLIREFSFSQVVSPRQYVANKHRSVERSASRNYLGVGNPTLSNTLTPPIAENSIQLQRVNELRDLGSLPDTALEIKSVSALFKAPNSDVLLDLQASEETLRSKALADYDVIHVATHGLFNLDQFGQTDAALVLTPEDLNDPFNDGILSASEIARLSLSARIVMLSACNTAKYNPLQANIAAQDFQAAFTIAGTPTIVASLWPIESQTAQKISVGFFSFWRSKSAGGAANSLARATREFLDRSDIAHQHPRFWAAFIVAGNGSIEASPLTQRSQSETTLLPLKDFHSGGEILDSIAMDNSVVLALIAEWNGSRMAGIISRRNLDGTERWRISSHEISVSHIVASGSQIFALGITGTDIFTPVLRSIDANGRLNWKKEFKEFQDFDFQGMSATKGGVVIAAYPSSRNSASTASGFLLEIDRRGQIVKQVPFPANPSRKAYAYPAILRVLGSRAFVIANRGSEIRMNYNRKTILGFPSVCFEGARAEIFEFELDSSKLKNTTFVESFNATRAIVVNKELVIGGEAFDNCTQRGVAAIYRYRGNRELQKVWKDDGIFPSSVRGMTNSRTLNIAVNTERSLGIARTVTKPGDFVGYKRWGDNDTEIRAAFVAEIPSAGQTIRRREVTAGLSVFLQGLDSLNGKPFVYGSVGGVPAASFH